MDWEELPSLEVEPLIEPEPEMDADEEPSPLEAEAARLPAPEMEKESSRRTLRCMRREWEWRLWYTLPPAAACRELS